MTRRDVRPYMGPSEAQSNADALARRGTPYTEASGVSFRVRWDWTKREPSDLREAVRIVRRAYADEVPNRLHQRDELADDGTPKMAPAAEGYIFGHDQQGSEPVERDADGNRITPVIDYYRTPFRATLAAMTGAVNARRAAIVSHVTIGGQEPEDAAMAEGVPWWCAKIVAEHSIRHFLTRMSDVKLALPAVDPAA